MSSTDNLQKLHSRPKLAILGRQLYSQRKYEEAVEAFSASIDASNGNPSLSLLASRAAALEKLDKVRLALKDGRQMIQLEEDNAKGYLFTGRLLSQLGDDSLALKIYQRGLRFCNDAGERERLQSKLASISKASRVPGQTDPVLQLPAEIVQMIFAYLPFKSLCTSLKVTKSWKSFLASSPNLWTDIDFSFANKNVRFRDLIVLSEYAKTRLTHMTLKCVHLQGSKNLEHITRKNRSLQSLTLLSGGELGNSLLQALDRASNLQVLRLLGNISVTYEGVKWAVRKCPRLVELQIGSIQDVPRHTADGPVAENLEILVLLAHYGSRPLPVHHILLPGRHLKRLICKHQGGRYGFEVIEEAVLKSLDFEDLMIEDGEISENALYRISKSVRKVDLRGTNYNFSPAYPPTLQQSTGFPKLESLSLNPFARASVVELLSRFSDARLLGQEQEPGLLCLKVDASMWQKGLLTSFINSCSMQKKLRALQISGCAALQDTHVDKILRQFVNVEELALDGSSITGAGVKEIVNKLRFLKRLDICGCREIRPDAVQWARNQGIRVKFFLENGI